MMFFQDSEEKPVNRLPSAKDNVNHNKIMVFLYLFIK